MSLMRTLARVAMGVAVAKGAKSLTQSARSGKSGTMLDDMFGPNAKSGSSGGLGGILDNLRGTQATGQRTRAASGSTGGLGGLLSSLQGGGSAGAGGLGGIIGALGATGAGAAQSGGAGRDFGQKLQSQVGENPNAAQTPEPAEEGLAAVMLLAMVQAAQADGQMDEIERSRIRDHLNDATDEEREFVNQAMNTKISPEELAAQVPEGAEAQVYAMSLMAIDLNHPAEVDFLRSFADALGLQSDAVNDIHSKMGAVPLYS